MVISSYRNVSTLLNVKKENDRKIKLAQLENDYVTLKKCLDFEKLFEIVFKKLIEMEKQKIYIKSKK